MKVRGVATSLALVTAVTAVLPGTAYASSGFDMRKKVVSLTGIMDLSGMDTPVTRAEFASMLVNATEYRSTVTQVSNTAVFSDVARDSSYASSIRIASEQGWMNGFLGGNFKPEQYVTLQEAVKGILALLGYSNSDFIGDQSGSRMSKYYYLELNDEVNRDINEVLTKSDCVNLFYNLLKTDTKGTTTHYGKVLDCELTSDGEINPLTLNDTIVKGPKLVKRNHDISDSVPFSLSTANLFLNGSATTISTLKTTLESDGYLVLYYNTLSKSVWAYSEDGSDSKQSVIYGEVTNIYYQSTDVLTPTAVVIDGTEYQLTTSETQFAFSVYGDIAVGDDVALVYTTTENSSGDTVYNVIDYLED